MKKYAGSRVPDTSVPRQGWMNGGRLNCLALLTWEGNEREGRSEKTADGLEGKRKRNEEKKPRRKFQPQLFSLPVPSLVGQKKMAGGGNEGSVPLKRISLDCYRFQVCSDRMENGP